MHSGMQVLVLTVIFYMAQAFNTLRATAVLHNLVIAPYIKPCNRSEPNFNECALKHGQEAMAIIMQGDPAYHIPNFKPFLLDYVGLEASENMKLYAENVSIRGFEGTQIKDINWDFENKVVKARAFLPLINIQGTYNMIGRMLIMNIKGSGPMNNSHYDNDIHIVCLYSLKKIHNKEYLHLDKFDVHIQILKGVDLYFGNILNNPQISDQMNAFLNENWKILTEDLAPSINRLISDIAVSIINPIVAKIPLEKIILT